MKAVVFHSYGKPEVVLKLEEITTPVCGDDEILVKIKAHSVNPNEMDAKSPLASVILQTLF